MGWRALRVAVAATVVAIAPAVRAQPQPDPAPAPAPDAAPAVDPDAAPAVEPTPEGAPPTDPVAAEPPAIVEEESAPETPSTGVGAIQVHGFVSEGGFVSTSNDYIGRSSRGSLELFEAGINFSGEITNRLRAGIQLFARDFGDFDQSSPRVDWAFLDYQWRPYLGLRAGIIKMPFGLYNEYTDIDAARLPILMPQGVYPFRNRDVLLAHRGFALYGTAEVGGGHQLEYQAWLGTLGVPENALTLSGATLDSIDTKYVTGAQLYYYPPVDGLRVGGTWLRASIDFNITLSAENVAALIMLGLVPPDFDGGVVISQRPDTWVVGSAEYVRGEWLFAAEYARAFKRQVTDLPMVIPGFHEDAERFYGMVTRRLSPWLEVGAYYSVHHRDVDDRRGRDPMKWAKPWHAFQRDAAATVRFDINEHWLWKVEGHFIDGAGDIAQAGGTPEKRYWGLFLFRTTVTF
jgi:hypothetical protein